MSTLRAVRPGGGDLSAIELHSCAKFPSAPKGPQLLPDKPCAHPMVVFIFVLCYFFDAVG